MQTEHATDFEARLRIDRYVAAFESACRAQASLELDRFLPEVGDPLRELVACELIRVDLECRWERGESPGLDQYRRRFAAVFANPQLAAKLDFELRRQCCATRPSVTSNQLVVRDATDSAIESRLQPGETLVGFELVREIGRGTFSRVFLAREAQLAGRSVVLKVTRTPMDEPQLLAQLQHTNIVPIYSLHALDGWQVVCMPFYGTTTLADLMHSLSALPTVPVAGAHFVSTIRGQRSSAHVPLPEAARDAAAPTTQANFAAENLQRWQGRSFVDAVLWLAGQLAAGLTHAHERGILHLDLKPANVLLTDDGSVMLLDFNLSRDLKRTVGPEGERIGGTLPYMAPEQLRSLRDGIAGVDHRTDLYALGMMMWQLLTGQPVAPAAGSSQDALAEALLELRSRPQPNVRTFNQQVPFAVQAIVAKCLAPRLEERYPTAAALREDLERQLADRPLRYADEPSWRERAQKWRRRHPKLTSSSSVAAAAILLIAALSGLLWHWRGRLIESERRVQVAAAESILREFLRDKQEVEVLLQMSTPEMDLRPEAFGKSDELLAIASAVHGRGARADFQPALLADAERKSFKNSVRELGAQLARAHADVAQTNRDPALAARHVRLAQQWQEILDGFTTPGPPQSTRDEEEVALIRSLEVATGDPARALEILSGIVEQHPKNYSAHFLQATSFSRLTRYRDAEGSFATCIALRPDFAWAYFGRGVQRLKLSKFLAAADDFSRALQLRPGLMPARLNRALAFESAGMDAEALADLDAVVAAKFSPVRSLLQRAGVRSRLGDALGASQDRDLALSLTPDDEVGWIARGYAKVPADPQGALADFDAALQLNPRSTDALENQANIYAELLHDPRRGIESLDKILTYAPRYVAALGARSVLRARVGDRESAHADAETCLAIDDAASTIYQVAGVYALTSRIESADQREALRLLEWALQRDPSLGQVAADDRDLESLRGLAEFDALLERASERASSTAAAAE